MPQGPRTGQSAADYESQVRTRKVLDDLRPREGKPESRWGLLPSMTDPAIPPRKYSKKRRSMVSPQNRRVSK